tara:strand:- start:2283 stop:2621 length:339 start_codon:yes stop_codon:yes gene_type:complete
MSSRYDGVERFINDNMIYYNKFKDRGVSQVHQYGTRQLKFPTGEQITELNILSHTWAYGDRYSNLAFSNYGDPKLWWVIAFFNQQPTESGLAFGDLVFIPHPLERILSFYGV